MSAGKKFDAGKSPVTQGCLHYFPMALQAVAQVSAYGCRKYDTSYDDKNWSRLPQAFERYSDGLGRHLMLEGISAYDAESHLLHAAHAAWNALARLELLLEQGKPLSLPQVRSDDDVPF